jgi:adenosylhomocysteinase
MDDGADLVSLLHKDMKKYAPKVKASMEETTTGVIRLRALEARGDLRIPVIAVNDADTKHLFDNRYGTGQSTLDGIIRSTDLLVAGRTVVVSGYGWCGRGVASRADGMGAQVIVTEIDPIRGLEAVMDGYRVMPMDLAAREGDVFITVTGNMHAVAAKHFKSMKDGAVVCNAGHFDIEIDVKALAKMAKKVRHNVRPNVDEYILPSGKRINLLAQGRLVNLAAAEGHPASVMDMSFATQALAAEWACKHANNGGLEVKVHTLPRNLESRVATLKLASMGFKIDKLSPAQKEYLASWTVGT